MEPCIIGCPICYETWLRTTLFWLFQLSVILCMGIGKSGIMGWVARWTIQIQFNQTQVSEYMGHFSNWNERYSFQLFAVVFDTCLVWEMLMLPSDASCHSKLALFEGPMRIRLIRMSI